MPGFVESVAELVGRVHYAALLPGSDAALLAVSEHRDRFAGVPICLPSHEKVRRCLTKLSVIEESRAAGLGSPRTEVCETVADAAAAVGEMRLPVLLKPWTSVARESQGVRQRASRLIATEAELARAVAELRTPVLVQRRLGGAVYSLAGVRAGGETLAMAFSRYERTWPPEAGPVSCSISLEVPPDLGRRAEALLDALGWEGIFELELVSASPAHFAAIDLNPRVYGSLELANRAGAPLAAIWCDWLLSRASPRAMTRSSVRYRWEDAEARNLARTLRTGRIREVLAILRPRAHTAHAHFRLRDPGPLLARALELLNPRRRRAARRALASTH